MKQLTQEQRNWRILGASGAIEGYRCRLYNLQRVHDIGVGVFIGFIAGLILAGVINTVLPKAMMP